MLSISVWGQEKTDLTQKDLVVPPDGKLSFPLAGTVVATDRTLAQVAEALRANLSDHLTGPVVNVTLKTSLSKQVIVLGEVRLQGPLPFHDRMSVTQAIGAAGGPLWAYAKTERCHIVRGSLDDPKLIPVDLDDVWDGNEKNVFLEPGDIVLLPAKTITKFDRYVTQMLTPLRFGAGAAAETASAGTTIGTSTLVFPGAGPVGP